MCDTPRSFSVHLSTPPVHDLQRCGSEALFLPVPKARSQAYEVGKRCLDVFIASVALVSLLPFLPVLMLLVKCSSRGSIFYRHVRVGKSGREFSLLKFRTMRCESDELFTSHLAQNPAAQWEWFRHQKLCSDPRVTPTGRFLRCLSLDELPQLLHVLTGTMSLVGPRPITSSEIWRYGSAFSLYASVKPGMTGLWQVSGRGRLCYEERVELDLKYVMNQSLRQDLRILLQTPSALCDWPSVPRLRESSRENQGA